MRKEGKCGATECIVSFPPPFTMLLRVHVCAWKGFCLGRKTAFSVVTGWAGSLAICHFYFYPIQDRIRNVSKSDTQSGRLSVFCRKVNTELPLYLQKGLTNTNCIFSAGKHMRMWQLLPCVCDTQKVLSQQANWPHFCADLTMLLICY